MPTAGTPSPRPLPLWAYVVLVFALSRAVIAVIGVVGAVTFLDQHTLTTLGSSALHFDAVWRKWDVLWYERVATEGYRLGPHPSSQDLALAGFFPLYPFVVAAVEHVVPMWSFFTLGSLLSNAFSLGACLVIAY